jgi:capsular polysaccharide biosynthesis protein
MNKRVIFHIENRGSDYIFHWYTYMLAGLRYINTNVSRSGPGGGGSIEQNKEFFISPVCKPFNICFSNINNFLDYQRESLSLINAEYTVIPYSEITPDDIVINNYGEFILNSEHHIDKEGYIFLRNLFLKNYVNDKKYLNKKYYISRNKSHMLHGNSGVKRRQVVNDDDVINVLKSYNFEIINLEDYNTIEKIKIFNQSNTIISPNSAALTFSIFSNYTTNIIELNVRNPHQIDRQYMDQCSALSIPYYKCFTEKVDNMDNMFVNVNELATLLVDNKLL